MHLWHSRQPPCTARSPARIGALQLPLDARLCDPTNSMRMEYIVYRHARFVSQTQEGLIDRVKGSTSGASTLTANCTSLPVHDPYCQTQQHCHRAMRVSNNHPAASM